LWGLAVGSHREDGLRILLVEADDGMRTALGGILVRFGLETILAPDAAAAAICLVYGPPVEDGFYYEVECPVALTPEHFPSIQVEIARIVKENRSFVRRECDRQTALSQTAKSGDIYKTDNVQRARGAVLHTLRPWAGVHLGSGAGVFEGDRRQTLFIAPGSPWENAYSETFNSRMGDELLKREVFTSLTEAQVLVEQYRRTYNEERPHSALEWTPATFAAACVAAGSAALRPPQRTGQKTTETLIASGT